MVISFDYKTSLPQQQRDSHFEAKLRFLGR